MSDYSVKCYQWGYMRNTIINGIYPEIEFWKKNPTVIIVIIWRRKRWSINFANTYWTSTMNQALFFGNLMNLCTIIPANNILRKSNIYIQGHR